VFYLRLHIAHVAEVQNVGKWLSFFATWCSWCMPCHKLLIYVITFKNYWSFLFTF